MLNRSKLLFLFVLAAILLTATPSFADQHHEPPDVFRLVTAVRDEIDHLRWYMGRPELEESPPAVRNVSPHEVYFQAATLFAKADRLAFELTLEEALPPPEPTGHIVPADVYAMVEAARKRLAYVADYLRIENEAELPVREASRTPTDVFKSVVQANRQLNLMLEHRFSPSDVFRQVTVAISYADSILAAHAHVEPPLPSASPKPGMRPADVHRRLLRSFELVRRVGDKLGLRMLELDDWGDSPEDIRPSDVFDVASLLVAELAYIHKNTPGAKKPRRIVRVRGKFPSDVYQRVGVLERLLKQLLKKMP